MSAGVGFGCEICWGTCSSGCAQRPRLGGIIFRLGAVGRWESSYSQRNQHTKFAARGRYPRRARARTLKDDKWSPNAIRAARVKEKRVARRARAPEKALRQKGMRNLSDRLSPFSSASYLARLLVLLGLARVEAHHGEWRPAFDDCDVYRSRRYTTHFLMT